MILGLRNRTGSRGETVGRQFYRAGVCLLSLFFLMDLHHPPPIPDVCIRVAR